MSNYMESKKKIDSIRCKDEPMFRMAISHLMDVGIRHLTEENVLQTCRDICKEDDSNRFITNEYMCGIVRMAGELAKIPHIDLFVYIQREVEYDVYDSAPSYTRAIKLLKNTLSYLEYYNDCNNEESYELFYEIGLDNNEIENLGFKHLIPEEEEE